MKTVLLFAHDDEGQEARLQAALDVTRAVAGHLSCIDVIIPPTPLAYNAYSGFAAAELIEGEVRQEQANRAQVETRLAHEDVTWSWTEVQGAPASAIEAEARLADLIVLSGGGEDGDSDYRALIRDVLRTAKCPILVVNRGTRGIRLDGTVMVAWNGSREASDALHRAVPLLRLASEVVLYSAGDRDGPSAAEPAAQYLSRHGIHVRIDAAEHVSGAKVDESILEHARQAKADYIVMGAYGRSATSEALFGGVTRSMLAHSDLPLLLAH